MQTETSAFSPKNTNTYLKLKASVLFLLAASLIVLSNSNIGLDDQLLSFFNIENVSAKESTTEDAINSFSFSSLLKNIPYTSENKFCKLLSEELSKAGIANSFKGIRFIAREERIKKNSKFKALAACFEKLQSSDLYAEIDIFTADYGKEKSTNFQTQVSIFSIKTSNKIAELGFNID